MSRSKQTCPKCGLDFRKQNKGKKINYAALSVGLMVKCDEWKHDFCEMKSSRDLLRREIKEMLFERGRLRDALAAIKHSGMECEPMSTAFVHAEIAQAALKGCE